MKKFVLVILLMALMCLPLFAGGGQSGTSSAPASDGLTSFKIWGWNREYTGRDGGSVLLSDWYDGTVPSKIWDETVAELARRGIKLDLELVMEDQTSTVFQTLMATRQFDSFDMIHSPVNLPSEVRYNLVNQKRIVPIDQIINQYSDGTAKNFFATEFGKRSQGLINMPDGHMYWLPNIVDSWYKDKVNGDVGSAVVSMIRKDWLDTLNLPVPKTTEEFYNTLVAFQRNDLNRNNLPDEVASLSISNFDSGINNWFGVPHDANMGGFIAVIDNKAVTPWYATHVKDYLAYMNRLYTAGLINISSEGGEIQANKLGYWSTWMAIANEINVTVPSGASPATSVPFSIQAYPDTKPTLWDSGGIQIDNTQAYLFPTASRNQDKAALLIDWFFTSGYPMFEYYGIEGYTYRYLDNGSLARGVPGVSYVGKDREIMVDGSQTALFAHSGIFPWFINMDRYNELESTFNITKERDPASADIKEQFADRFAAGEFTTVLNQQSILAYSTLEESSRIAAITPDLNTYASELVTAIIMGEKSLNNWDSYIADLKRLGLDDLLRIYQDQIDRTLGK
jgi:ABC-type glycerol-3-phosphate transport system substrate-binding protein